MEENAPAGSETSSADPTGTDQAVADAGELPGANPFAEMVGEVPLEAELRESAARNSGVQINETYQIQTDTPAGGFLSAPTGYQTFQDPLACIGMSVKVTCTIEATGVPTGEASMTGEGDTPTQTVITHRNAQGMIVNVLDGLPGKNLPEPPGGVETDDLYRINTEFAADLLGDGGKEALAQLMETYHPTLDSPLDVPTLELDFNQFELDETRSGPETSPQAVNTELNVDLEQASLAIDICQPCVKALPGAPVTLDKSMLALVTSVGKRSVRHPQLSAPSPLTLPRGPLLSALDTPTSQLTPILTTLVGRPPFRPPPRSLVPFPRPTLPASASLAAPLSQESDWEAEMDPVPPGHESQQ